MSSEQEVQHLQVPCVYTPSRHSTCLWCKCLGYSTGLFNSCPQDHLRLNVCLSRWHPHLALKLLDLDP